MYAVEAQDRLSVIVGTAVDGNIVTMAGAVCALQSNVILRGNADRL